MDTQKYYTTTKCILDYLIDFLSCCAEAACLLKTSIKIFQLFYRVVDCGLLKEKDILMRS